MKRQNEVKGMPRRDAGPDPTNVNVTLGSSGVLPEDLQGKEFPCPLCEAGLPILASRRNKPYCTCNACGVQLFVRGKAGIVRLTRMARQGILLSLRESSAAHGIALFNRLEQLKLQKTGLQEKRGILFANSDLENTIQLVDAEIESVQGELAKSTRTKRKEISK